MRTKKLSLPAARGANPIRKVALALLACLALSALAGGAVPPLPAPYTLVLTPGTPEELPSLEKIVGATVEGKQRHAEKNEFWSYGFRVAPGSRCRLVLTLESAAGEAPPQVVVFDQKAAPLSTHTDLRGNDLVINWTVPRNWRIGERMIVQVTAKIAPCTLDLAQFSQIEPDTHGVGLPDNVITLLRQGQEPTGRLNVTPRPATPYTVTQSPLAPTPDIDLQTDAVFAYSSAADILRDWKARGYAVWTMGGLRDGEAYAAQHKDEIQTTATGLQLRFGSAYYFAPTENRLVAERAGFDAALAAGSDGVCPEEPEYWADAGYSPAFKQAWQAQYHTPWQNPADSIDARWKAGRLMATMESDQIDLLLLDAQQKKPNARRMVALHSPLAYAQAGIVSPHARIAGLASVQDVVGQVWTDTARAPMREVGVNRPEPFFRAYLEYSSFVHLLRSSGKRLWFLLDPLGDDPATPLERYRSDYEQTLIAALLFPDVNAYEVMPWPERVYGHIPVDYAIEINSVIAALQDMHAQPNRGDAAVANADIGLLLSDSMQWQRVAPNASDLDGVFGLTLPLLERGLPVQILSLDRAADPGYLNGFKTLLLSYDFQKPLSAQTQSALADWVRRGGSLLFFGGSDPDNALADSWWRQAKRSAPQEELWAQLGIALNGPAKAEAPQPEDLSRYKTALFSNGVERYRRNRKTYTVDLSEAAKPTGSVGVRFTSLAPKEDTGPWLASATLRIGGQLAAAFQSGSEIENRFLSYDLGSAVVEGARVAERGASWTYRFDNLPANQPVTLSLDLSNSFVVSVSPLPLDFGHTLLGAADAGALTKTFPRMRIGFPYVATVYPESPVASAAPAGQPQTRETAIALPGAATPSGPSGPNVPNTLFTLRSGGVAVWAQAVERGVALDVGVAPGYFSGSERSASLLRALVQYARLRTGTPYHEAGALRLQRGAYTIVRTLSEPETVAPRTIDLLSPTLAVATDRVIPPNSVALLYDPGPDGSAPRLGFLSGRLMARIETPKATTLFARGPLGTVGVARLLTGGKRLIGAHASDRLGRPLEAQAVQEGNTVLVRYANDPDGVILHIGWQ